MGRQSRRADREGQGFRPGPRPRGSASGASPGACSWNSAKGAALRTLEALEGVALTSLMSVPPPPEPNRMDPKGAAFGGGPGGKASWRVQGGALILPAQRDALA